MWHLAIRNLRRHRRRSALTIASVLFGLWVADLSIATFRDLFSRLISAGTRTGPGDVAVTAPGPYELLGPLDRIDYQKVLTRLTEHGERLRALPRVSALATAQAAARSTGALLLGLDPSRETAQDHLVLSSRVEGASLSAADPQGCLVGHRFAKHLGVHIGSRLVITAASGSGQMAAEALVIRGIFRTGSGELDQHLVVTTLATAQTLMGFRASEASLLALFGAGEEARPLAQRLRPILANLGVATRPWQETLPELWGYIMIDTVTGCTALAFIAAIVFASILNTMTLSVVERHREFGVMLALGMTPWSLIWLVSIEAAIIAAAGLGLGAVTLLPVGYVLAVKGLDLSGLAGAPLEVGGFALDLIVGYKFEIWDILWIVTSLAIVNVLATLLPAVRAARTEPCEALRHA